MTTSTTSSTTPIVLLDVDGVLNAICDPLSPPDTWSDYKSGAATAGHVTWPITFSPTVVRTLQDLHETRKVEIRWLTTWAHEANGPLRDLLGFPNPFEVVGAPGYLKGRSSSWWKLPLAQKVYETTLRPLVWIDDDLSRVPEATYWVDTLNADRTLALSPQTHIGITPEDLECINDFVNTL